MSNSRCRSLMKQFNTSQSHPHKLITALGQATLAVGQQPLCGSYSTLMSFPNSQSCPNDFLRQQHTQGSFSNVYLHLLSSLIFCFSLFHSLWCRICFSSCSCFAIPFPENLSSAEGLDQKTIWLNKMIFKNQDRDTFILMS